MRGRVLQKDGNCRYKVLKCTGNSKMVSAAGVKLGSGAIEADVRERWGGEGEAGNYSVLQICVLWLFL